MAVPYTFTPSTTISSSQVNDNFTYFENRVTPVANGGTGVASLTAGYLVKGNGTSAASASVVYDDGTNVGIGAATPGAKLDVGGDQRLSLTANQTRSLTFYNTSNSVAYGRVQYADTTGVFDIANLQAFPVTFSTGGSERMRINSTGNVSIGNTNNTYKLDVTGTTRLAGDVTVEGSSLITSAGGLGYGTGSGGAVTQITSRTTGVTLNKTNGTITLVSAAGSATWQSFTVTNSTVAATDVVKVCQKSGTDLYMISVTAVAAGSFRISFATTGGTTTEQPVFNFAIIKAVTS